MLEINMQYILCLKYSCFISSNFFQFLARTTLLFQFSHKPKLSDIKQSLVTQSGLFVLKSGNPVI